MTGIRDYTGLNDRDILISIAERMDNLEGCMNRMDTCLGKHDELIQDLRVHGAAISQQNAKDVREIFEKINILNTEGPAVPSKEALVRIEAVEKTVKDLNTFKDTCSGGIAAVKDNTARNISIVGICISALTLVVVALGKLYGGA